jgi:hypothetical protein
MAFYNIIVFSPKGTIPSPLYKPITQYVPDTPILPSEPIYMKKSVSNVKNNLFLALDDEVRRPLPSIHRAPLAATRLFIGR